MRTRIHVFQQNRFSKQNLPSSLALTRILSNVIFVTSSLFALIWHPWFVKKELLPTSDYFAIGIGLLSISVFVIGFASVRMHANRDQRLSRYELIADRAIETSRASTSYPRPSEFSKFREEVFAIPWSLAVEGLVSIALSSIAMMVIVWLEEAQVVPSRERWIILLLPFFSFASVFIGWYDLKLVNKSMESDWRKSISGTFEILREQIKELQVVVDYFSAILDAKWSEARLLETSVEKRLEELRIVAEELLSQLPESPWAYLVLALREICLAGKVSLGHLAHADGPETFAYIDDASERVLFRHDARALYLIDRTLALLTEGFNRAKNFSEFDIEIPGAVGPAYAEYLFSTKSAGVKSILDQIDFDLFKLAIAMRLTTVEPVTKKSTQDEIYLNDQIREDTWYLDKSPKDGVIEREIRSNSKSIEGGFQEANSERYIYATDRELEDRELIVMMYRILTVKNVIDEKDGTF